METQITYTASRTARARLRGSCLVMTIPRHWPRSEQEQAIAKFTRWGQKQTSTLAALPVAPSSPPMTLDALKALVETINRETVGVSYAGVRIGSARYSRLAQVNLRTRILTFSRYAINGMPERALRYLILHELAHLVVPNHSRAFWALVAKHLVDFRQQRAIAQQHFQMACHRADDASQALQQVPLKPTEAARTAQQLRLF